MSKKINWNIPVPRALDEALEQAVNSDSHASKSEFVRDCVRRKLEDMGFESRPFTNPREAGP